MEITEYRHGTDGGVGHVGTSISAPGWAGGRAIAVRQALPRRLALFGLPEAVAEPVALLAEILGWQVLHYPVGMATRPEVQACLAMLPTCTAMQTPPLVLWSPERNLNEHISQSGLSIMDQPLCVTRVEQMLEALSCEP